MYIWIFRPNIERKVDIFILKHKETVLLKASLSFHYELLNILHLNLYPVGFRLLTSPNKSGTRWFFFILL